MERSDDEGLQGDRAAQRLGQGALELELADQLGVDDLDQLAQAGGPAGARAGTAERAPPCRPRA